MKPQQQGEAQNQDRELEDLLQLVPEVSLNKDIEHIPGSHAQAPPLLDIQSNDNDPLDEEQESSHDNVFEDALMDYNPKDEAVEIPAVMFSPKKRG